MTTTAEGMNGQVAFDGRAVTITREGLMGRASQGRGSKVIPLSAIGAVQYQPPTLFSGTGVWSVSIAGEVQSSKSRRTMKDVMSDENSVVVRRGKTDGFEALSAAVNAALVNA